MAYRTHTLTAVLAFALGVTLTWACFPNHTDAQNGGGTIGETLRYETDGETITFELENDERAYLVYGTLAGSREGDDVQAGVGFLPSPAKFLDARRVRVFEIESGVQFDGDQALPCNCTPIPPSPNPVGPRGPQPWILTAGR